MSRDRSLDAPLPRASIVVATLDRAAHLGRLLDALERLDYPAFEVIVVNGPSTDDTDAVLARYHDRLRVVRCPETNLSRSRNLGIAAAAGDLVAFIDDDALPASPAWLRTLAERLRDDPTLGGVGGPSLRGDSEEREFSGRLASEYAELLSLDEAGARRVAADGVAWVTATQGNNGLFRRDALATVGGFDENYAYYLEETDLCLRLARAGRPIAYVPSAPVRHYSALGPNRRTWHDRRWDVMARSDVYYGLRNARDPLPRRAVHSLAFARTKFPYRQINDFYTAKEYGRVTRYRYLLRWARGVARGLWWGVARRRRTRSITPASMPFLPFRT